MASWTRVAITVWLTVVVASPAAADPRADFLRDYADKPQRIRDAYTNVTCLFTYKTYAEDGKHLQTLSHRSKYTTRCFLNAADLTPGVKGGVYCYNPKYYIHTAARPGGELTLNSVTPSPSQLAGHELSAPFAVPGIPARSYLEFVSDPAHRVTDYRDASWAGVTAKRVTVKFPAYDNSGTGTAEFYFAPDLDWVCLGERMHGGKVQYGLAQFDRVYTYEPRPGEVPVLKTIEWRRARRVGDPGWVSYAFEITEFVRHKTPFPESDFTLSAYGFPEPEGLTAAPPARPDVLAPPPEVRPWWWVWTGGSALAVMAVTVALARRRARRRAQPLTPVTP